MDAWLWTPLTEHASRVFNRIRNIVDSPGGNPESEPELATATVETTEGRGATLLVINFNFPTHLLLRFWPRLTGAPILRLSLSIAALTSCSNFLVVATLLVAMFLLTATEQKKFVIDMMYIACSTVVLQCYRRQAIPMEQAKIRPSVTLYSLQDRSLLNLVWLITSEIPTQMPS